MKLARIFFLILFFLGMFSPVSSVFAASSKGYEAFQVISSGLSRLTLAPGESKQISVSFQNKGTKTWTRTGKGYVSVYTYGPKYRDSRFADSSWISSSQPTTISQDRVAPGEIGQITFSLRAPSSIGTYQETFRLAAEDIAWITGGELTIPITVKEASKEKIVAASGLSATILLRSKKQIQAAPREEITYKVGIKNSGSITWNTRELRTSELTMATVSSETRHASWISPSRLLTKTGDTVAPGSIDFFNFTFNAPSTGGKQLVQYKLAVNDTVIPDFTLDIPVDVTGEAGEVIDNPLVIETPVDTTVYVPEPTMRIGILIVDEETNWETQVSCASPWKLKDGAVNTLGVFAAGEKVTAKYRDGFYWYQKGDVLESTSNYLRFEPDESNAVCTVENFDRRLTRKSRYADNQFRNVLELRYNAKNDRTWLINELPMEIYLRGLGETSNDSHQEFKKALVTVARTYAFYHFERATKHADEYYHMNAYADDQVYKGYGQEVRAPLIAQAVEDTRGKVVTYEDKTALTPYFSRSDGRTRHWSEVWYGNVAWLKSVPAPCDLGRTMWGHGVGMSASEALCQANNGKVWDEIVHYFYKDVAITKRWK